MGSRHMHVVRMKTIREALYDDVVMIDVRIDIWPTTH
jgi:hypothetical protein